MFNATGFGQTPTPSPAGEDNDRYSVTASTEIGGRWLDVNGNENKFRSDLNYRQGFRVFDSSIMIEDKGTTGAKLFDSALFMGSGWGADPSGYFRANMERNHVYRLDANVRRVSYFNFLNNHAIGNDRRNLHNADRHRNLGDFDLTLLPDNRNIRFRVGYSYNLADGSGSTSTRISRGDIFPLYSDVDTKAHDFRLGADGNLFGFNISGTYGYRNYKDRTLYTLTNDPGDVTSNTNRIISLERRTPVDGDTHYGVLSVQRTFAKRFDFTAKLTHAVASTDSQLIESLSYINTSNVLVNETYNVSGNAKRPQTRADLGMTWRVTDRFRLSNTFTYDGFNVNGGNIYAQVPIPGTASNNYSYFTTRYRRYTNLFEGDYQFNERVGINLGWRYTNREISLVRIQRNLGLPVGVAEPEDAENSTHSVIAGAKIKPTKNWAIYADIEGGKADNVFTRLANYEFFNFRVRSRASFNKFAWNASFITKDNDNPGQSVSQPASSFITEMRARIFSTSVDWDPINEVRLSAGYDYTHFTSEVSVLIPLGGPATPGLSQYFVRDNYFFIDAHVRPIKRVTLYGSYRWNKDDGHGDRAIPALTAPLILSSYPIDFKTPEFRASIRLNRYLDWNVGYQYYDYDEETPQQIQYAIPFQNYRAHLPYMSLRIYLGRGKGDRW
ncbi:MAG: TonB-dependent receptor [Pyrinomonadaceae bacterium]|nr:TonB-dependent receptor [Pyrinomonadaceae bacterium]